MLIDFGLLEEENGMSYFIEIEDLADLIIITCSAKELSREKRNSMLMIYPGN